MVPDVIVVSKTQTDWPLLRSLTLEALSKKPSEAIAQYPVNFTGGAELLLFSDLNFHLWSFCR